MMNLLESIKIGSIIGKYLGGKESSEEIVQLKNWLNEDSKNQILFNSLKKEKNVGAAIEEFDIYNKELAWKRYKERMDTLSLRKMLFRWKIAAVFFFLIGCSGIVTYLIKESITPLSAKDSYTTISTNNGQNSKVILPDSSVVWINSGTTLSYNTNFAVYNRTITLTGQAFFQIVRNEHMPLIVNCNGLNVKVLGTRFDVSAYPEDNNITVVLESGKVELLKENNKKFVQELKPGEKGEFNIASNRLSIDKVNSEKFTAWKDGVLIFENDEMSYVIDKLERWYNVDIEVDDKSIYQLIFNATIVNESVGEILELMKFSCGIHYEIIPSDNPNVLIKVKIK